MGWIECRPMSPLANGPVDPGSIYHLASRAITYLLTMKIHSSCEIKDFVETHFCKLCVILRLRSHVSSTDDYIWKNARPEYHAACKDEHRPLNWSNSPLTYSNKFKEDNYSATRFCENDTNTNVFLVFFFPLQSHWSLFVR